MAFPGNRPIHIGALSFSRNADRDRSVNIILIPGDELYTWVTRRLRQWCTVGRPPRPRRRRVGRDPHHLDRRTVGERPGPAPFDVGLADLPRRSHRGLFLRRLLGP